MPQERFLVTGCAGFIGGHMLEHLIEAGFETVGIDDFSTGSPDNLTPARGRFRFIEGSVADRERVREALEGVTRVIHLASVPSVPRSVDNPLESALASVIGTVTLLDECVKAGVKRVVQSTSSSAYGDNTTLPRVETLTPRPMSPYAVAKATQEHYARVFSRCYGLDTASLRYFNIFGPRQNPNSKYAAVIPKFITEMRAGRRPVIFGDGLQTRDFTFIENALHANTKAALSPENLNGEVFNVGAGKAHSLNDLVGNLNRLLGTDITPQYAPPRTGDVRDSLADVSKAKQGFGYQPRVDFLEGLRRTAEYY